MPREEPFFKKCCYCVPLKSCLHVWSIMKWMVDISLLVFLIILVLLLNQYHELRSHHFTMSHMFIIIIVVLFIDSVFMILFTVGLCTNNLRTLRKFFYYSFFMVFIETVFFVGFLIYALIELSLPSDQTLVAILAICLFINVVLDVCVIFTVKSEMIKLRNKQQFQFVEMPNLAKDEEVERNEERESFQHDADKVDV